MRYLALTLLLLFLAGESAAQKAMYLEEIRKAAEKGWEENGAVIARWKEHYTPSILWGYDAPGNPVYLASTLAFLYEQTHERQYAARAAGLLAAYGDLRSVLPNGYAKTRAEYAEGVPSLSNFFFLAPYVRAYLRIRESGVMTPAVKARIERDITGSVDFIFHYPEWGAHNRAMLRAEALRYAALAFPDHPHAARWRQLAEVIASDNIAHWEIEDASNYNPVWLYALFSYADASGRPDAFTSAVMRYYMEYYVRLIGPNGTVPDFGDAVWNSASGALRLVAIFEKAAAVFRDPEMKWAASTVMAGARKGRDVLGVGDACSLTDAYRWADESIAPRTPHGGSQEVLEEVVGKKVVFRNGWDDRSLYCLLDYRDEGDGGAQDRAFLRHTITAEEEKTTHGHSDENSIVLLMNKGSLLLHDAGYRDSLPSGPYGSWRADYFHNRVVARLNKRDPHETLLTFLHNSGAYRPVRTEKIDFQNLRDADMSRTRLTDEVLGYQWDRVVTYVRDPGFFVVIDGLRINRADFFTFAALWHARDVLARGPHFADVATDSLPGFAFPRTQSLLIYFPESYAKQEGIEPISRHGQMEHAVYQSISSQYKAGDMEMFVTVLVPHDRGVSPEEIIKRIRPMECSDPYRAFGLELHDGARTSYLCVRLDLEKELRREDVRPRYSYSLGKVTYGDFESDAHYLFSTVTNDTLAYSASNVLQVHYKGHLLMSALPYTFGLQPDGGPDRIDFPKWRRWEEAVTIPR